MKKEAWSGERLETFIVNNIAAEHLHRYGMAKTLVTGKRVLDIACGEGYGSRLLAETAETVTGVDIAEDVVIRAARIYKKPNLVYKAGNCAAIPLADNSVDIVISFETLEHHDEHEAMLTEIKRVLAPGGILIISTPDKKLYSDIPNFRNIHHVKELYDEEFRTLVKKYFTHTDFYFQKYVSGSLIINDSNNNHFDELTGNYTSVNNHGAFQSMYNICIAGDAELPKFNASIFKDDDNINDLIEQAINKVQQSNSFKLGQFILSPVMLVKKWIR